jgi:hypothetical protein
VYIKTLLAYIMVLSMTACQSKVLSEAPSSPQSGENLTTNTGPTQGENGVTEPSSGFTWEIKDVAAPEFEVCELTKAAVTQYNGRDVTTDIIILRRNA